MGADKFHRLSDFRSLVANRLIERRAELGLRNDTTEPTEFSRELFRDSQAFIKDMDVDLARLRDLRTAYIAEVRVAVETGLGKEDVAPLRSSTAGPPDPCGHDPWRWVYPPYNGAWGTSWDNIDGRQASHRESGLRGEIAAQLAPARSLTLKMASRCGARR
jgi:hypothetical protein